VCRAIIVAALVAALTGGAMAFELQCNDFAPGGSIPVALTCEGVDRPPELAWAGEPAGTKSLALVMDDPDAPDPGAPRMTWVHWVLYDIPPGSGGMGTLPSEIPQNGLPDGPRQGTNDWKQSGYRGPCPPIGRHRYFHKLYALDVVLGEKGALTKAQLERLIAGHVLAQAELIGTYQKRGR
jgi:Raf kinase inhibitor-like YbhB/YbcL family protein